MAKHGMHLHKSWSYALEAIAKLNEDWVGLTIGHLEVGSVSEDCRRKTQLSFN